ncbi:MAG: hypothetical protein ABIT05_04760 [Chitinophagaceae bacterium]
MEKPAWRINFNTMNGPASKILITLPEWSSTRKWIFRFIFVFVLLFILSVPFPHPYLLNPPSVVSPFFENLVKWTGDHVFKIRHPYSNRLISDSTGLYIHLAILFFISLITAVAWGIIDKRKKSYPILAYWFRVGISYYLAFYLMSYGFNKLFKRQFYIPEPNTLFTTMGNTYRDLLYWSSMGVSRPYNIFLGSLELLAGILLLFRKTRLIGSLLAISILLNIVAVNLSYNINVKIFSCFLLWLALLVMAPAAKRLYNFFFTGNKMPAAAWEPQYVSPVMSRVYITGKVLVIGYMLWCLLVVYIKSGNFNDDQATRPPFHGAYEVISFSKNNDTLPPLLSDTYRWKRVFIHRRGYFIIQFMNDDMQDYDLYCDTLKKAWYIQKTTDKTEAVLQYRQTTDTTIRLTSKIGIDSLHIDLLRIDLSKLPLLQKEFSWTVDESIQER